MKSLVGGPLLVGGLGPGPPASPLKSGPGGILVVYLQMLLNGSTSDYANQWVRLPVWGFLLVFLSDHNLKCTVL